MEQIPGKFLTYKSGSWILATGILFLFSLAHSDLRDALLYGMFCVMSFLVVLVLLSFAWRNKKSPYEEAAPLVLLFVTGITTVFSLLEIAVVNLLEGFKHEELIILTVISLPMWSFMQIFCSALIMWSSYPGEIAKEKQIGPWTIFLVLICEGLALFYVSLVFFL